MADPKPKPQFEHSLVLNGDSRKYCFLRGDKAVLELTEGEPVEDFLVRLCDFMNRDRRPVIYLEDRIISLRELVGNCLDMVEILNRRLSESAMPEHAARVKDWIERSVKLSEQIRKEAS